MKQHIDPGNAAIRPEGPVVAGCFTTIEFVYTAGHPIDDTGFIKIAFRYGSDFGTPQFHDPAGPNFSTVQTDGDCRIEPRWDPKGHTRPWGRALYLKVMGGFLNRGEQVRVVFGDTSQGSPGWQVQSFCEDTFEFKTLVDPIATNRFKELPVSPELRIVAGPPVRAVCIAPSRVEAGRPFACVLKLEDKWGNPVGSPKRIPHPGVSEPGIHTVEATDADTGLAAVANPTEVVENNCGLRPYWADFHGQSEETIGTNTIRQYFTFARDFAGLDIAAHQGNDFQVTDEFWGTINAVTAEFHEPGKFLTFPGYEWSGNTPLGGDRNVYFSSEGGRIVHSCTDLLPGEETRFEIGPTATELFARLREQRGHAPFVFAHVGGRYADMAMHDSDLEVAVEVHSAWGTFEWLIDEALERGYRIGICANSDGHKGRPGASYPGAKKFGSYGGLTCVLASALTREAVVEALRARHFYATTGCRLLLDVHLENADQTRAIMGDVIECPNDALELCIHAAGTAPIESVEIRNGTETLKTLRPEGAKEPGRRVKILWSGAEVRGRDRIVRWDGRLRVRGNSVVRAEPINFWNANEPLQRLSRNGFQWTSVTTGGPAGLILTLDKPGAGLIELQTAQRDVACRLRTLGTTPRTWTCGGLRKQIQAYRLPAPPAPREIRIRFPLRKLHPGDNPIYVRVTQEDGHMAWSSPMYLIGHPV